MALRNGRRVLQAFASGDAACLSLGYFSRGFAALPSIDPHYHDRQIDPVGTLVQESDFARRMTEMREHEQQQASTSAMVEAQAFGRNRVQTSARARLQLQNIPSRIDLKAFARPERVLDAPGPKSMGWRDVVAVAERERAPQTAILTDLYQRQHTYLRISLTERCNLRCQYCMPAEGVDLTPNHELLTVHEIERLARIFVEAGVDKIRLTGGEPTVRRDLVDISERLGKLGGLKTLAMTTNGIALARQLPALKRAGLSTLNISLDTLQPERFERMTRRRGHDRVLQAITAAVEFGFAVKVNVVLMRGQNDDEINQFVEMTRHMPINVRFIEYMPFDNNAWTKHKMYTYREMMHDIQSQFGPLHRKADPKGEVAKNYHLEGFQGTVSFITSMTEHFCSDCNRLRLMADGNLKVCLFGANEVSLRDAMREGATDDELRLIISAAVKRKKAAHADMDILAATKNRAMIKIGG